MTKKESLRTIAEHWMEDVWQRRRIEAVDSLHARTFTDHSPADRDSDNTAYKEGLAALFEAFPDFYAETEDLIIDIDAATVAIRWTATGTHKGQFMGYEPTGRVVRFRGIEILKIEDGLVLDRWGELDGIDLLEQLA